ncbi:alpha/beta-hydrolase [Pyrenophora tritici-repentis]|nr:alpha/beta-hydrolase [Pyrenophora tritici-repentis]
MDNNTIVDPQPPPDTAHAVTLYLPSPDAPDRQKAAITFTYPGTSIKEQASGLYARKLAENGFVTLAYDAAFQGESGGEPRYLEDPYQQVEDVKSAVTFLSTLDGEVDPERIGVVGICSGGGYAVFASQTDVRMKAVATVGGVCLDAMHRNSLRDESGNIDPETLHQRLSFAAQERIKEAKGEKPTAFSTLDVFEAAKEYYATPRGYHPKCNNLQLVRSFEKLSTFDACAFIDWIAPRPLLMIMGSLADTGKGGPGDTGCYSKKAIENAKEPKELFVIEGKEHLDLYSDTEESVPKLADFMAKALCT